MPLNPTEIRNRRHKKGMSAQEAAVKAGISVSSWYAIEHQDRGASLEMLDKIARALCCHPGELLTKPNCNSK